MKNFLSIAVALAIVLISACKKEAEQSPEKPNTNSPTYVKIGETWINGASAKAVIYAEKNLVAGYNKLYVKFTDSLDGSQITKGELSIMPLMDMGMMMHSAPAENSKDSISKEGFFNSNIAFIMSGMWSLDVRFNNYKNNKEGVGKLSVEVDPVNPPRIKSITDSDSNKIFISYIQPVNPQVGINDFEIAIHKMSSMNDFPAVTDYTIEIEPEMPSMGHGSPNNVNPVHVEDGHYRGKVNFTMTGLWRIHVTLKKGSEIIGEPLFFDITF